MSDGDRFNFGKTVLTARHTPGHTPEHMSYVAAEKGKLDTPFAVFTGDSLFVSSAGRPDLLGDDQTEKLVKKLHATLFDFYLKLNDDVIIYPGHGHGSPCGADIGDRLASTIGYERRFNAFLQHKEFDDFHDYALSTAPPTPTYYPRMKKLNAAGPDVLGGLPLVPAMPPKQFNDAIKKGKNARSSIRVRCSPSAARTSAARSTSAPTRPSCRSGPAGCSIRTCRSCSCSKATMRLEEVVALFVRTGFTEVRRIPRRRHDRLGQRGTSASIPAADAGAGSREAPGRPDACSTSARRKNGKSGHIPGATHRFLPDLREKRKRPNKTKPIAVYCDSGYRASLAASWLQANGFKDVRNVPGSWQAWTHAGLPVEKDGEAKGARS